MSKWIIDNLFWKYKTREDGIFAGIMWGLFIGFIVGMTVAGMLAK